MKIILVSLCARHCAGLFNMHNGGMDGSKIEAIRKGLRESQAEFGLRFGVDQSTIHRWETKGVTDRGVTALAVERILSELPPAEASPEPVEAPPC